jgi:hypothetical protein
MAIMTHNILEIGTACGSNASCAMAIYLLHTGSGHGDGMLLGQYDDDGMAITDALSQLPNGSRVSVDHDDDGFAHVRLADAIS